MPDPSHNPSRTEPLSIGGATLPDAPEAALKEKAHIAFVAALRELKDAEDDLKIFEKRLIAERLGLPTGYNALLRRSDRVDFAQFAAVLAAARLAEKDPQGALQAGVIPVLRGVIHSIEHVELAADGLGWLLAKPAFDSLLEISDQRTVFFIIARAKDGFLYRAVPSGFYRSKDEWVGADHNGVGGMLIERTAKGDGHIKATIGGAFRGEYGRLGAPESFAYALDIRPPGTEAALQEYRQARNIAPEQTQRCLLEDYKAILEKLASLVEVEQTLLIQTPDVLKLFLPEAAQAVRKVPLSDMLTEIERAV